MDKNKHQEIHGSNQNADWPGNKAECGVQLLRTGEGMFFYQITRGKNTSKRFRNIHLKD